MIKKRLACSGDWPVVAAILACIAGGFGLGVLAGAELAQDKAIEAGAARWIVDAKTGKTTFEYCCKCEEPAKP